MFLFIKRINNLSTEQTFQSLSTAVENQKLYFIVVIERKQKDVNSPLDVIYFCRFCVIGSRH